MANDLHPAQKPIELMERAIGNSSKIHETVLDAFGGSGSTLIACERTGRQARLIETDPRYVDTAVIRWHQFARRAAVLEKDGRSFTEIAAKRALARCE